MKRKDPRLIGFSIGFVGVIAIGVVIITGLGLFNTPPSPTLAPTVTPASVGVTAVPSGVPTYKRHATPSLAAHGSPQSTPPGPSPSPTRAVSTEYTVRDGDTLFDIALVHGVDVTTIQQANSLEGETIVPGQVLIIPPGPLPTPTTYVEDNMIIHAVSSGETLIGIAGRYSVAVEVIQENNALDGETIQPGWQLRIPIKDTGALAFPTSDTGGTGWQPSILTGNLSEGYPLTLQSERFTLHYQPDTPAARTPAVVLALVEAALDHIESELQVTLLGEFDVYMAGSLFAPDDSALRGRSFSSQRRNFYLYDDTGTPDERRYVITHELTHMLAWHTLGQPSSVMLHEGLAVFIGIQAMEDAGFIPLDHFCLAYRQVDQLPRLSGSRSYLGHIRDLDLYFSAGCFAQYLIQTYGVQSFKQVFNSGDYPGVYGHTLSQLETEWLETLDVSSNQLNFDPDDLVSSVADVADAYETLFADFNGTPTQMAAYRELDQARIAMLQGRFEETKEHLGAFKLLLANQ